MPRRVIVKDDFGAFIGAGARVNYDGANTTIPTDGMDGAEWDRSPSPPFTAMGTVNDSISIDTSQGRVNLFPTSGASGFWGIEPHVLGRSVEQEVSAWIAAPSYAPSAGGYGSQFMTAFLILKRDPAANGPSASTPRGYALQFRFDPNNDAMDTLVLRSADPVTNASRTLVSVAEPTFPSGPESGLTIGWQTNASVEKQRKITLRHKRKPGGGMTVFCLVDDIVIMQADNADYPNPGKMDVAVTVSGGNVIDTDKAFWLYRYEAYDLGPVVAAA